MHATEPVHPEWLQECKQIYLDVGSNIGVQVRKLYEPSKYPLAEILPLFDTLFGPPSLRSLPTETTGICALGMEPNPVQRERLETLEAEYLKHGWHVHFYPFAASFERGTAEFELMSPYHPAHSAEHDYWGAHLNGGAPDGQLADAKLANVTTVDFGIFIQSLPRGSVALMKMDIEGAEYDALASMGLHHVACNDWVPEMAMEVHDFGSLDHWQGTRSLDSVITFLGNQTECARGPIHVFELDDESYMHDG